MIILFAFDRRYAGFHVQGLSKGFRILLGFISIVIAWQNESVFVQAAHAILNPHDLDPEALKEDDVVARYYALYDAYMYEASNGRKLHNELRLTVEYCHIARDIWALTGFCPKFFDLATAIAHWFEDQEMDGREMKPSFIMAEMLVEGGYLDIEKEEEHDRDVHFALLQEKQTAQSYLESQEWINTFIESCIQRDMDGVRPPFGAVFQLEADPDDETYAARVGWYDLRGRFNTLWGGQWHDHIDNVFLEIEGIGREEKKDHF